MGTNGDGLVKKILTLDGWMNDVASTLSPPPR